MRSSFVQKFVFHLLQLCIVVALSLLVHLYDDKKLGSSVSNDRQTAAFVLSFLLIPHAVYTFWVESIQVFRDRKTHFRRCLGHTNESSLTFNFDYFRDFWNLVDLTRICLTCAFVVTHLVGNSHFVWLLSLLSYLMWFSILYFLQAFGPTASLVRMIIQICLDIRWFLVVLCLCILATGNAFYVLLTDEADAQEFFSNVARTLFTLFNMLLLNNGYNLADIAVGPYNVLVRAIFAVSMVFVSIILLNLLIGLFLFLIDSSYYS